MINGKIGSVSEKINVDIKMRERERVHLIKPSSDIMMKLSFWLKCRESNLRHPFGWPRVSVD